MKFLYILTAILTAGILLTAGCVATVQQTNTTMPEPVLNGENDSQPAVLVAYFSRTGTTRTMAEEVRTAAGGNLFEIKTVQVYPEDYTACTALASKEKAENARPELASHVENISAYDVVFVGYPIWHGTIPMAVASFLEEYDLSGKIIVPFCTSGGSGIGQSVTDIAHLCPDSVVLDGMRLGGWSASAKSETDAWVKQVMKEKIQ